MSEQFRAEVTQHGLKLGKYATLTLVTEDAKGGLYLWLTTERWRLEVRITPGGAFRIGAPRRHYEH